MSFLNNFDVTAYIQGVNPFRILHKILQEFECGAGGEDSDLAVKGHDEHWKVVRRYLFIERAGSNFEFVVEVEHELQFTIKLKEK